MTGLSMQMRYRAAIMKETGDWLFGVREPEFWNKNDKNLVIVNGF